MFGGPGKDTRELEGYSVGNELNDEMQVYALDKPGPGGASHNYVIAYKDAYHPSGAAALQIQYQKGAIKEAGLNGVSDEALLAIIIDRAKGFAEGPYPCEENDKALHHLQEALRWKQERTKARMARGVEGTMAK
jgi:hypothetical protein